MLSTVDYLKFFLMGLASGWALSNHDYIGVGIILLAIVLWLW